MVKSVIYISILYPFSSHSKPSTFFNTIMGASFFLKPNVVIEPLYDRWYAWSHLISPATAAMNTVGRHLKIMDSYLKAPEVHAAAVKNPKMLGGPFIDCKKDKIQEIQRLKETIIFKQAKALEFEKAIRELDQMLMREANGTSLESLYEKVPPILRGYLELVYDLNNNPSFRFFESLLYTSEYYRKESQSIALWITENDERPFCLSTPRLNDPNTIHVDIPFEHKAIDELSKMKRNAGSIEQIANTLGIQEEETELFRSFFTEKPHPSYRKYEGDKARIRYFGHACILLETDEVSVLIDPLIAYYGYDSTVDHYSDIDIPDDLDYILITHNHQDHILFETLLPLRHKTKNIIVPRSSSGSMQDPSLKLMFNSIGFENIIEIDEMEAIRFQNCVITGIPFTGEHADLNIHSKTCYHVDIAEFTFLFVADSSILEKRLYEHIHRAIGDVDVLFLGMECEGAPLSWLYGPLMTKEISRHHDEARRLSGSNRDQGIHLVNIFNPKEVYVYAMGQEPWLEFISSKKYTSDSHPIVQSDKLIEECADREIVAERLYGEKELFYNYQLVY